MKAEINDDVFGLLRQDVGDPFCYSSTMDFQDSELVHIVLCFEELPGDLNRITDADFEDALERAKHIFNEIPQHENNIRLCVANAGIENYNENWNVSSNGGVGNPISEQEFMNHMKIGNVIVYVDGEYSLSYTCDCLFTDHVLIVELNAQHQISHIKLAG